MIRMLAAAALALATLTPAPAAAGDHAATGSFTVKMTPVDDTRLAMAKTYAGGLAGMGTGPFVGDTRIMVYVALETFAGTLDGRKGGFTMMHRGWQGADKVNHLDVTIAPNSGTGELARITGALDTRIDAKGGHFYTLRYSLPGK